jgi:hypothetical protein
MQLAKDMDKWRELVGTARNKKKKKMRGIS